MNPEYDGVQNLMYLLNCELYEQSGWEDKDNLLTATSDGFTIIVEFGGVYIWDSENDDREYVDEEKYPELQVSLDYHLRMEIDKVVNQISKIKLSY